MNSLQKKLFLLILIFSFFGAMTAQRPVVYDSPGYEYALAKELFEKEKFGSAQDYFKQVFEDERTPSEMKINSYYYMGVCAIQLNHQDADYLLRNYIRKYPVHSHVSQAYFHLGKFYYNQKKYKQALENFNNIQERNVPAEFLHPN